jgi:hypothetical protein
MLHAHRRDFVSVDIDIHPHIVIPSPTGPVAAQDGGSDRASSVRPSAHRLVSERNRGASVNYRTPTPNDAYLSLLGRAAYTWSYTEWGLIYAVRWATGRDLSGLAGQTGGAIVGAFAAMVQAQQEEAPPDVYRAAVAGSDQIEQLNRRRNDILHARPATIDGEQRLYRWAPTKAAATPGPIQLEDLEAFIQQVEHARGLVTGLEEWLRSQATP